MARAAETQIGAALTAPKPLLRAFVREGETSFKIPSTHWLRALDAHLTGSVPSRLSLALLTPRLPPAFSPYTGQTALYEAANVGAFVALLGGAPSETPDLDEPTDDPVRPWRQFRKPGAVKKWLMHPVAATTFADQPLAAEGVLRPTERDRRAALDRYLTKHLERLGPTTVGTYRREGKHAVG